MSFLIKDLGFYKLLFSITLPIAAQNFITFAVSMADSLMIGKVSELALSSVNLANQPFFILMIITFGITSANMVFAAQYWGKGDVYSVRRIITILMRISVVIGTVAGAIVILFPEEVMTLYSDDPDVIATGAEYLKIIGWAYPIYSFTNATVCIYRAAREVKVSIVVYSVSLVVNVFLNWVLIFGKFGFEAMGIRGAATATVIARVCELIVLMVYLIFIEKNIRYTLKDFFVPVKEYMMPFLKTGAPVIINETIWSIGSSMLSMIIGHISTEFVSANSIANIIWQSVWVVLSGMGNATAVIIGNSIGMGEDKKTVRNKALSIILISAVMGLFSSLLLLVIRGPIIDFYAVSDSTKKLAYDLIVSYAIVLFFQSMAVEYVVGIFRGGGDTKTSMIIDTLFLWTLSIPLGAYVGLVLKLEPTVVYLVLRCDELIKCTIGLIYTISGRWIRDITVKNA